MVRSALPVLVLLAASGAASPSRAAGEVVEQTLVVEGRIRQVLRLDLDGDGRKDLLVVSTSGHASRAQRRVSLFWQGSTGSFAPRPDVVWQLPAPVVALDGSPETEAREPATLYSLQPDGVYGHRVGRGDRQFSATRVLAADLGHLVPPQESVLVLDFVSRWRGEGPDLLVPALPHPLLFSSLHPSARPVPLPVAPVSAYGLGSGSQGLAVSSRFTHPVPVSSDQDGDGRHELVFLERDQVSVVGLDPARGSAADGDRWTTSRRAYPLAILSEAEVASDLYEVDARLVDLDGDGRTDLVATVYRDAGLMEFEGRAMVFRARPDGSLPRQADQSLALEHAQYFLARPLDLDGDGRMEILIPAAKLGVFGVIRLLTSRRVSFQLHVFDLGRDGTFGPARLLKPARKATLSKRYDLPLIQVADFDGDGLKDLAIGEGDDEVCLYRGEGGEDGWTLGARPTLCFAADPFERFVVDDLDGDGKQELIRHPVQGEGQARAVVTFLRW